MTQTRIFVAVFAALLLGACGSPAERAADYIAKAQARYDAGDLVEARIEAQNAIQVEPKNVKARYLLSLIAEDKKDFGAMYGHLMVVVAEDPKNVEARLKLATLYLPQRFLDGSRGPEQGPARARSRRTPGWCCSRPASICRTVT